MILWHATDYQNIPNIMAKGIIPNRYNEVFFADNCASAMMFVAMRGHTHIVALPVEFKPAEVKESFDHSQEFYRCRAYTFNKLVEPTRIMWDKARKVNLEERQVKVS